MAESNITWHLVIYKQFMLTLIYTNNTELNDISDHWNKV